MDIRKAQENDFSRIMELSHNFNTSPFTFDKRLESISRNIYPAFAWDMIHSASSISLVAEEKYITGFITVSINTPLSSAAGKKIGNILLLVVDENRRNEGIGSLLVRKALGLLFTLGAGIITVGTDIYNYPAVHIYESSGFKLKMGWHIFRFYKDEDHAKRHIFENIDTYDSSLDLFCEGYSRPVSLLKEKAIDREKLRAYLLENFKKSILNKSINALQYYERNKPSALITFAKDEIAQKTLQTDQPVYKVLDLIVLEEARGRNIEKRMLIDITARIYDYCLMEIWIDSENSGLIQAAEDAGFRLSYTGLTFHLVSS